MTLGMLPEPGEPVHARRSSHIGRWLVLVIVLVVVVGAIVARYWVRGATAAQAASLQPSVTDTMARAPAGVRVRVRVLNATTTQGLARRATFALRDFGYDVVDFDSDRRSAGKGTRILSHTGHADWAQRLQRALGTGVIEQSADTLRYVDFTVLLGSDWKPPAQSFRP